MDVDDAAAEETPVELSDEQREEFENYQIQIEEIKRQVTEVEAGTHPEILEKSNMLQNLKRRREEVARTYHEHLLDNAKGLQEFEKLNATAALQTAIEALKESLLDTVAQEVRRVEEEVRRAFCPDPPVTVKPIAAPVSGSKRLKRPYKGKYAPKGDASGKGAAAAAAAKAPALPACVTLGLTDLEMRSDFTTIINDCRARTLAYLNKCADSSQTHVELVRDSRGVAVMRINGAPFRPGDRVIVWSRVTDEEFSGEVTAVTGDEVFILLVGEVPTRLHFEHIANGRLSLTKESR